VAELWTKILSFFELWGWWVAAGSALVFVVSIAALPWVVAQIPEDYFVHEQHRRKLENRRHPVFQACIVICKNVLGLFLLIAGFIMLFTPGQGLLSMLFGLMIMNYPGKYRLECWLISRQPMFSSINALRAKQGKPPLLLPEHLNRDIPSGISR
jgi:hypothetical protein